MAKATTTTDSTAAFFYPSDEERASECLIAKLQKENADLTAKLEQSQTALEKNKSGIEKTPV
jgi:hypothetical protein